MKRLAATTLLCFALCGCEEPPTSHDSAVLATMSEAWQEALNRGDVDELTGMYTRNARVLPPNSELTAGHDAVRAEFGAMIDAGLVGDVTSIEARAAGDIGYNVGLYEMGTAADGIVDRGKFIEIWRLESDGRWRISNDIFNSDLEPRHSEPTQRMAHATVTLIHEVDDPAVWLAAWQGESSRKEDFKRNGAMHVHVFQDSGNPNMTGLVVAVADMEKFQAFLQSDEGVELARQDTVRMNTLRRFTEVH